MFVILTVIKFKVQLIVSNFSFFITVNNAFVFVVSNSCISVIIKNYTHIHMKVFTRNDRYCPVALRPNAGHGLLILEVSRSHTTTHHSR